MAENQAGLDADISAEDSTLAQVVAAVVLILSDVQTLLAQIAGGTPAADLTAEGDRIKAQTVQLQDTLTKLQAGDAAVHPPAPPAPPAV